jgi:hypothetical protein
MVTLGEQGILFLVRLSNTLTIVAKAALLIVVWTLLNDVIMMSLTQLGMTSF